MIKEYHVAWLEQTGVEPEFLGQATMNGFDIHHVDGDHSNNDPNNLVLIFSKDHFKLHGCPSMGREAPKKWQDILDWQRERITKGASAYAMRKQGTLWKDIATKLESDAANITHMARRWAILQRLQWPIPKPQ